MASGYYFRDRCDETGGEILSAISSEDAAEVAGEYLRLLDVLAHHGFCNCCVEVEWVADLSTDVAAVINRRSIINEIY